MHVGSVRFYSIYNITIMMKRDVRVALDYAFKKGFQIHPEVIEILGGMEIENVDKVLKDIMQEKLRDGDFHISGSDLVRYLGLEIDEDIPTKHEILFDCTARLTMPVGVEGFSSLFKSRFKKLKSIMEQRPESKNLRNISNIQGTSEKDIYICGLVNEKTIKDNTFKLTLEDMTGTIEGFVAEPARETLKGLFLDQFVMVKVDRRGDDIRFIEIIQPDIPLHTSNHADNEVYAVLLSDLHIGSKYFMEREFREFLDWLASPDSYALKVRFVLVAGDIIDGVGVFPNQDKELVEKTTHKQLEKASELFSLIPDYIKVFISPGNHDPGRRALPQPAIPRDSAPNLWNKKNIFMLGNPALLSINSVKILMFHGQSIDDIVKGVTGMEYSHPADVMKGILRVRHLSPIFGSQTPIAPENEDLLVIEDIPDVFHAGHVHVTELDVYKGIKVINSGAWQRQTPFQLSVGQIPTPGIAVLFNLKTHQILLRNFLE